MFLIEPPKKKQVKRPGKITINRIPPKSTYYDSNNTECIINELLEPDEDALKELLKNSKRAPK